MPDSLSTDPYKGVRDFYPDDMSVQRHIFAAMGRAAEKFGYEEYAASILEPSELYKAKGAENEEMVNEQTYTFTDRGDREVTLRPEMTPSVARMVAARKRELAFPLRWYSIQNFFRYERPQRGRLREFWQLNADLFGPNGPEADAEIIALAREVMRELGATDDMYEIRVSDRRLLNRLYDKFDIAANTRAEATRLLDKRDKDEKFEEKFAQLLGNMIASDFLSQLDDFRIPELEALTKILAAQEIKVTVDTSITRGFDYYTGMVFEVFDTNPENKRSMFGGGRFDKLMELFGQDPVPAVGFGMGDVIARDFLETHGLLPETVSAVDLYLAPVSENDSIAAAKIANTLREKGRNVAVGLIEKKVGDHIKVALKKHIPFFAAVGADEAQSGTLKLKDLANEKEENAAISDIAERIRDMRK